MTELYRSIGARLLWMIRLAIVVSLVSYPLSGAMGAMHGSDSPFISEGAVALIDAQPAAMQAHDHGAGGPHGGAGKAIDKQDCCQSFCMSLALPLSHHDLGHHRTATIQAFYNDSKAVGQISALYRPPSA